MNDTLEVLAGILVFMVLIWPVIGFIWIMRWISRREKHELAALAHQDEVKS